MVIVVKVFGEFLAFDRPEGGRRRRGDDRARTGHSAQRRSEFERAVEHTDWRADAAKEGPYSKGHARSVHRGSERIDNFLGLPGLAWLCAIVDRDWELALIAAAAWVLALVFWTPWTLWRVWGRDPKDVGRAA